MKVHLGLYISLCGFDLPSNSKSTLKITIYMYIECNDEGTINYYCDVTLVVPAVLQLGTRKSAF